MGIFQILGLRRMEPRNLEAFKTIIREWTPNKVKTQLKNNNNTRGLIC